MQFELHVSGARAEGDGALSSVRPCCSGPAWSPEDGSDTSSKQPSPRTGRARRRPPQCPVKRRSQRQAANHRERARMQIINAAFERLKARLPPAFSVTCPPEEAVPIPASGRVSKVCTLRMAIDYIHYMRDVALGGGGGGGATQMVPDDKSEKQFYCAGADNLWSSPPIESQDSVTSPQRMTFESEIMPHTSYTHRANLNEGMVQQIPRVRDGGVQGPAHMWAQHPSSCDQSPWQQASRNQSPWQQASCDHLPWQQSQDIHEVFAYSSN